MIFEVSWKIDALYYYRWHDAMDNFDNEMWKNNSITGIQPKQMLVYSKIDFADFLPTNESDDSIVLNLENTQNIDHTFPKIDRCCKLIENVKYNGIDDMERINCDISQDEFTETYVHKREAVMMVGCQDKWKAKHWTIENLLNRYNYIPLSENKTSYTTWPTEVRRKHETKTYFHKHLRSNDVKRLINDGNFVKIFRKLPKGELGWIDGKTEYKQYMLELMEEYTFPKPMPEDVFYRHHVETDQAYLMLATAETGNSTCISG